MSLSFTGIGGGPGMWDPMPVPPPVRPKKQKKTRIWSTTPPADEPSSRSETAGARKPAGRKKTAKRAAKKKTAKKKTAARRVTKRPVKKRAARRTKKR